MVRRTRELIIKGVNFCEFIRKEKKALKVNWDAQISAKVDTKVDIGRCKSPTEYIMLFAA